VATRVLSGVTLAVVLVWLGVNAYPYAAPEPLWTRRDLPAMPDESTNGWVVIINELELLELPRDLATLIDEAELDGQATWARVERDAAQLHAFLDTSAAREANDRLDAARQLPAFVVACEWDEPCPLFTWSRAHDGALLRAIALAHAGELAESSLLLRDLIRMDSMMVDRGESLLTVVFGLKHLEQALYTADVIVAQLQPHTLDAQTRAALTELAAGVRLVSPKAVDLRKVVIADYLYQVEILKTLNGHADPRSTPALERSAGPNWLLNHALTLRELNERFERRYAAAIAGDKAAALGGGRSEVNRPWGWWFRNPVGKQLLELLDFPSERYADGIDERLAALEQGSARLLARPALRELEG